MTSFETEWTQFEPKGLRLVSGMFRRNPGEISDVLAEACFDAFRNWERFNHESEASTWFYRITLNRALARQRQLARRRQSIRVDSEEVEGRSVESVPSPEEETVRRCRRAELANTMATCLNAKEAEVVVLHHYAGLSYAEIALVTGAPSPAAVNGQHRRALSKLRKALRKANRIGV